MGGFSIWHWLVVGIIILLLFGKGRFSEMMGDVAKGLKSFKKGISEDDAPPPPAAQPRHISDARGTQVPPVEPTAAPPADPGVAPSATPAAPAPDDRREG